MNQNKLQVSGQFLYSFTVVAKHMSFTKAAEDLCITQSAVSHRIRCLEQELVFPLFHRLTRKIILTEEGKTLYGALDASLKQIHETIRNIQEAELQGDLVIACAPSIAGCWLLPLLPGFQHEHPNISLHIRSGNDLISYENEEGNADVAIYCGDSITDGLHATPLLRDNLLPVCSQRYAREHDLIENPEALRNCELIHEHPEAGNTPFYAGTAIFTHAGKTDYWILKEHVLPRLSPVEALHMPGLHQISLAYAEPGESAAWSEAFTEGCGENAGVHFSNICIDITAPDVSKAAGMTHLLELRRWGEAKEVLVIGDDMNDLPMIRHFNGHAVANAAPEVRDAASSVFLSVGQMLRERV